MLTGQDSCGAELGKDGVVRAAGHSACRPGHPHVGLHKGGLTPLHLLSRDLTLASRSLA